MTGDMRRARRATSPKADADRRPTGWLPRPTSPMSRWGLVAALAPALFVGAVLAASAAHAQDYADRGYGGYGAPPAGQWRYGAPDLDGQGYGSWSDGDRPASRRGRSSARSYGGASQQLDDQSAYDGGYGAAQQAVDPRFQRQITQWRGGESAGTIVIDTRRKYLFLVQGDGTAIRYGIGVGREGFQWKGSQRISMKREWPDWRPPKEMRKRRPDLPVFMPGGPDNPLGSRALYLGTTLYRIHGTNEPNTIGQNVSSGCIRLTNEDVMDLYDRVRVGAKVVVM